MSDLSKDQSRQLFVGKCTCVDWLHMWYIGSLCAVYHNQWGWSAKTYRVKLAIRTSCTILKLTGKTSMTPPCSLCKSVMFPATYWFPDGSSVQLSYSLCSLIVTKTKFSTLNLVFPPSNSYAFPVLLPFPLFPQRFKDMQKRWIDDSKLSPPVTSDLTRVCPCISMQPGPW